MLFAELVSQFAAGWTRVVNSHLPGLSCRDRSIVVVSGMTEARVFARVGPLHNKTSEGREVGKGEDPICPGTWWRGPFRKGSKSP